MKPTVEPSRRRTRRDPNPRFKSDVSGQLDAILGCPALAVPEDHLARDVARIVARLDTSAVERQYSSLGRHGYHPRHLIAVWVYASLIGIQHSTKLANALRTDAALRLLSGGHAISAPTLRRFRQHNAELFARAIEETIELASQSGLIDLEDLAVDSVRIRAHASMAAVRTVTRSTQRLKELSAVNVAVLDEAARERYQASLEKHREAIALCEQRDRTSIVVTNESAALMKFPSGASAPAHRATVVASGVSSRFVIGVLVDSDSTDHGKLGEAICKARDVLDRLGLRDRRLVAAADGGYGWEPDLEFAYNNRDWVDLLVPQRVPGRYSRFFGRDRFVVHGDGTATCPAGKKMLGPYRNDRKNRGLKWVGVGCSTCPIKASCTDGEFRSLQVNMHREHLREHMERRMAQPGAAKRYNRRIATVEPVFSYVQSVMGFRRCSSRSSATILSEVLLNLLAYNISRLIRADRETRKLLCVLFLVTEF